MHSYNRAKQAQTIRVAEKKFDTREGTIFNNSWNLCCYCGYIDHRAWSMDLSKSLNSSKLYSSIHMNLHNNFKSRRKIRKNSCTTSNTLTNIQKKRGKFLLFSIKSMRKFTSIKVSSNQPISTSPYRILHPHLCFRILIIKNWECTKVMWGNYWV